MSTLAGLNKKATKKALPWGQSKDKDSGEKSSGNKMSFSLGTKSSTSPAPVSKRSALFKSKSEREKEDRKKNDEQATAEVFAEFVASFEETPTGQGKAFVRGSVINAETEESESSASASGHKGSLYKPTSRLAESIKEKTIAHTMSTIAAGSGILGPYPGDSPGAKPKRPKEKEKSKSKSNLEMFKEELKREQEERDERHRLKKTLQQEAVRIGSTPPALQKIMAMERGERGEAPGHISGGSHDHGDPQTTNLYVGNLSPQMNEELLCLTFGKFGPLASVKIMWPRTDEEKARNRMCGFVAFMCREDGGKALDALNGKEVMGFELKMGWGKAVPIPPVPFYVAPELQSTVAATMPPPPSGKPFNAQSRDTVKPGARRSTLSSSGGKDDDNEDLRNLVIPVVIPHDRNLLCVIHRVIEFVVREGPMFEAMIMNKEINNPMFRFLFDNKEPAHIYYRWKLCSILQGERTDKWRLQEFGMFKGGSVWRPPPMPQIKTTLQAPTIEDPKLNVPALVDKKGQLSEKNRDFLEDMLHKITIDRQTIADGMVFCLDHADCAEEIVECITESLSILETPIPLKAARLYLVSDILYNCSAGVPHASHFRRGFESRLVEIFQHLCEAFLAISARIRADKFRQQVLNCVRAWEECAVYPPMFLVNLRAIFLGKDDQPSTMDGDVDGAPIDMDGLPSQAPPGQSNIPSLSASTAVAPAGASPGVADLDGAPLDLDGEPVEEQDEDDSDDDVDFTDRISSNARNAPLPSFKTPAAARPGIEPPRMLSKWEMVDEGADDDDDDVTTSNSHRSQSPTMLGSSSATRSKAEPSSSTSSVSLSMSSARPPLASAPSSASAFSDSVDSEEKRRRLREIEVKVVEYADRLEAKAKRRGKPMDIQAELEKYRQELLLEYDSSSNSDSEDDDQYNLVGAAATAGATAADEHDQRGSRRASGPAASSTSGSHRYSQQQQQQQQQQQHHSSHSSPTHSRSQSPHDGEHSRHQRSKRKRSNSPSHSSSRKHKRAKSPHRRKSPSSSSSRHSKRHSPARSKSPQRSRSRSPSGKRRKHKSSSVTTSSSHSGASSSSSSRR
eukprot:scpid41385/ scgid15341/ U2 snRNP-associated SURP motif-containing protein; 140 kDa Ser/Arg-rich domain protein; U2-associated protein SR140